jgi:hypothetical protein
MSHLQPHSDATLEALIEELTARCLSRLESDGRQQDVLVALEAAKARVRDVAVSSGYGW